MAIATGVRPAGTGAEASSLTNWPTTVDHKRIGLLYLILQPQFRGLAAAVVAAAGLRLSPSPPVRPV